MERIYTKSLLTIFLLLCSLMAIAHDFEVDGIYYDVTDTTSKTIAVTYNKDYKYTGAVTIPENVRYNGNIYKVTTIEYMAFWKCCDLTSITIPNSVTSIERSALVGCSNLESIVVESGNTKYDSRNNCNAIIETATNTLVAGCKNTIIPNSVIKIGGNAFRGCNNLNKIIIPNSVTTIGGGAFSYCTGLASMVVESGNTKYDSRNNCNAIIETATNTLVAGCKNTIIPNSVTEIGDWAFGACEDLTSIIIPNSITKISNNAFVGCKNLGKIYIKAKTPTIIDNNAFYNCYTATLYIYTGTKEAYQSSNGWKNFSSIIEIDEFPR